MTRATFIFSFFTLFIVIAGCNNGMNKTEHPQDSKKTATQKEKWHWGNPARQNQSAGYTQVVKTGDMLYISGIPTNDLSPKGITEVYKALGQCLDAYGASF